MEYLFGPFTSSVLKFFGIGPFWILYIGTIVSILGVILISSDKQAVIATAIATVQVITGKQTSRIRYSIGTLRKIGVAVLLLGLVLTGAAVDAMAATGGFLSIGYGGPSLYHCDLPNIVSWLVGSCGAVSATNSTLCIIGSSCDTDNISFHASAIGNSTASTNTLTSTAWTAIHNETMVVESQSQLGDTITSLTDTAGDIFTQDLVLTQACLPCFRSEFWTGRYLGGTNQKNQITIDYSNDSSSSQDMFLVATYLGVGGVGNATGITSTGPTGSFPITTEKSGSWIVGGIMSSGQAGNNTCPGEIGVGLIQRVSGCGIREFPGIDMNGDIEDNATNLRNLFTFTYSETEDNNGHLGTNFNLGALELIPVDKEPQLPNFNTFCTAANGLCVTSYSLNFAGTNTAPNSGAQVLVSGTAYCTGVTSKALTTTGHTIVGWGDFSANDRNVTGATMLVQFYISTTAPSTSFGSGLCAAGGSVIGSAAFTFTSSGIGAANAYGGAINGFSSAPAAGTWYGFIEITTYNYGSAGHMNYLDSPGQTYSIGSCSIEEIK
jgi:hypothetical protein